MKRLELVQLHNAAYYTRHVPDDAKVIKSWFQALPSGIFVYVLIEYEDKEAPTQQG